MTRKVIRHEAGNKKPDAAWDVFSNDPNDTADKLGLYECSDCKYVIEFAKAHPELRYVGSEDDWHTYPNHPPEEIP